MKKIISSILILLVTILIGVVISNSDSITYNTSMNKFGMSENATVLTTKSKKSINTVVKNLSKKDLPNYQIIFFEKDNPDLAFIYANKKITKVPTISGRYFSMNDFDSQIPFAVQGNNTAIKSYKPQSESYIKFHDNYISVIGKIGFSGAELLNQQTLISISPNQKSSHIKLKNVVTVVDGAALATPSSFKSIKKEMKVASTHRYVPQTRDFRQVTSPDTNKYKIFVILLLLAMIFIDVYVLVPLRYDMKKATFKGDLKNNYRNGLLLRYFLYTIIPIVIGYSFIVFTNNIVIVSHTLFNRVVLISMIITAFIGIFQIYYIRRRS
ncbi:hypothetical protein [Companilactobacillus metriopterae]|uniref:hypothetical protein n=1 Tax=Companilactobacillus metriopterae TaxID=1909267 RepID=UPI00100AAC0D|nr:hypothetical protein [Companilactobacillus metriopterae]